SAAAFASRVPAALLVLGAHYSWVVRSTLAFEEAAVEHAAKLARRIEAVRQGRWAARPSHAAKSTGRIRLRLAPTGGPGVAILWKNTVGATRDLSQRTFILIAVVVIGGSIALASGPMRGLDLVAVLLLGIGGLTLLFGPLAARCDLRQDLEMLDLLKGYPVRGRQVVGGEVAAPVTLIGLVVWSCLLGAFAATAGRQGSDLPSLGDRLAILLALLPATGAVLLVLVLVQNAAVLLFPAWVSVGRDRAVGLEATGQRILMTAGSMVVLVVALVPAVVVGGIAGVGGDDLHPLPSQRRPQHPGADHDAPMVGWLDAHCHLATLQANSFPPHLHDHVAVGRFLHDRIPRAAAKHVRHVVRTAGPAKRDPHGVATRIIRAFALRGMQRRR